MYKEHCECCAPEEEGLRFVSADNLYYYTELMNRFVSDQVKDELNEFIDDISVEGDGIVIRFSDGTKKVLPLEACKCSFSDVADASKDAASKTAATPKALANAVKTLQDAINAKKANPADLAGEGLQVKDNKLAVKPDALIKANGGLAVDNNGDIYVDFTKLPASEIEKVMKTLKVPIWVETNKYRNWYVDKNHANASDEIDEGRGQSKDKPFKTISACVKHVCENYNVNAYSVTININEGEYLESLALGSYSVTTGKILFVPYPDAEVSVKRVAPSGYTVTIFQGEFEFLNIAIVSELSAEVAVPTEGGCVSCQSYGKGTFHNCKFVYVDASEEKAIANFSVYMVVATKNGSVEIKGATEITANTGNYTPSIFVATNNGVLGFGGSSVSQEQATTTINGEAVALFRGWRAASIIVYTGTINDPKFVGNLAARKCLLATNACVYAYAGMLDMPNLTEGVQNPEQYAVYFE